MAISAGNAFRKNANAPLELPSGQIVKCRRSDLTQLMELGFIPNDLMAVASSAMARGDANPDLSGVGQDADSMKQMMRMVDDVTLWALLDPKAHKPPVWSTDVGTYRVATSDDPRFGQVVPMEDREEDDEKLYIDEMDTVDKTFIYGFVAAGNRDLQPFRRGLGSGVEPVSTS
jgi:hypothetical protein